MTLDPKDLTAEERALVDVEACRLNALGARGLPQPEKVFQVALANVENLILARRKFYGEAQGPGTIEMVESEERFLGLRPCGIEVIQPAPPPAPECPARPSLDPCDYNLAGVCIYCRGYQPAPPPAPDDCQTFSDGTPIFPGRVKPATVASELLPEPVRAAIASLHMACLVAIRERREIDAANHAEAKNGLHAWARSLPAEKPKSHDTLMSILYSLCTNAISIGKAQRVLMQWGNGEDIEDYAEADDDKVHALMFGENERSLTTASSGLPKVRELTEVVAKVQLAARDAERDLGPFTGNKWTERIVNLYSEINSLLVANDAAIAELDAAQAVGMSEELDAVLKFAQETTEMRGSYASDAWFWNTPFLDEIVAKIAAVRAQAANAQAVPVEAIRALLNGITSREQRDAVRRYLAAVEGGK